MALFLGLISGTSMDGIDAALVEIDDNRCRVLHARSFAYEPRLRSQLFAAITQPHHCSLDQIGHLDTALGHAFATAALQVLEESHTAPAQVRAIGSHGQTLRHTPLGDLPFTWQIADPNLIAERTGVDTVADFRRRDLAAGGEGAPLMPAFHRAVLGNGNQSGAVNTRAVLNLGGIANLTWLATDGSTLGFDTGPASCLMDGWIERHRSEKFDRNGAWAAGGVVDAPLLAAMLNDAYFARPAPKSTGRELFNLEWLDRHLAAGKRDPRDVQATLCELSAVSVAQAAQRQGRTERLIVCGGGAHNANLLQRLGRHLPGVIIEPISAYGLEPDFVEAAGFAWLASRTIARQAGNLPSVTGARHPVVLGAIYPGRL